MTSNRKSHQGQRTSGEPKVRRALNARLLLGTAIALVVFGAGAYFWRGYQVKRSAGALLERAESLAEEKKYSAAASYVSRYLELVPGDAAARIRLAEFADQSGGAPNRAVALYQEALGAGSKGVDPQQELTIRRRLAELMLAQEDFAGAQRQVQGETDSSGAARKGVCELEEEVLGAEKSEQWQGPGLLALALYGQFQAKSSAVSPAELEKAFARVLGPEQAGQPKVQRDPAVYLARYQYRLAQKLPGADEDLDTALGVAPKDVRVLLAGADAARRERLTAARQTTGGQAARHFEEPWRYCERAIEAAPEDERGYLALGQFYLERGDAERAVQATERGLKATENRSVRLQLRLAEDLIRSGRRREAEATLTTLDGLIAKLDPRIRLPLQRLASLRRAELLLAQGKYAGVVSLVTDLAAGQVEVVQGAEQLVTSRDTYQAWLLLGQAHAGLGQWDQSLAACDQAARLEPRQPTARLLAAAAASDAAAKSSAAKDRENYQQRAIRYYEQALAVVEAAKPVVEDQRAGIYQRLVSLLEQDPKRAAEAERYRKLRQEQIAESARLTLQGVEQAIREGRTKQAMELAQDGQKSRPEDPWAHVAVARASRSNKDAAQAEAACQAAVQAAKDDPVLLGEMSEFFLRSSDLDDRAEGEKILRGIAGRHAPACVRLVALLSLREKSDEALKIAQAGVEGRPQDPLAQLALGTAWWGMKDNAKAEAALRQAATLAPQDPRIQQALFSFYTGTGQTQKARETLDKAAQAAGLKEADRNLLVADGLVLLGDRTGAKAAYRKAVEASQREPGTQLKLAEVLLQSAEPAERAEGEAILRDNLSRHEPSRRRLVELLLARGGEAEWEEAQRLLQPSAGDAASGDDRLLQALTLARRGGKENQDKAAAICQGLLADAGRPVPAVSLLLGQILERQGRVDEARKQYRALVGEGPSAAPQLIARYVDFLLRRGPRSEADGWLKQLEKLGARDAAVLELRARWLKDEGRAGEIEPLVEAAAAELLAQLRKEAPRQEPSFCQGVGDLYARLEQYAAAQRWYRQLLKLAPDRYGPLAMALAKQGNVREAIAVCDEAAKTDKTLRPALTTTAVLLSGRAGPEDFTLAEPVLAEALKSHKDDLALLGNVAAIRVLEDRSEDAAQLYRQILKQQPRNPSALQNLATVLSELPEPENRKEAFQCVEQAIKLVGPQPALLDTKGMALVFDGKLEEAVALLKEAAAVPDPDPRYSFHLAVAYSQLGKMDEARAALKAARDRKLEQEVLTKMDRKLLVELQQKLDKNE